MMFVSNSGFCLLPAIHLWLGEADVVEVAPPAGQSCVPPPEAASRRRSNEPGILQELDEDLVDELVLRNGLDHEHPLLPEESQHRGHLHLFVVFQAVDHELREDNHTSPSHTRAAVNHDGGVPGPDAFQHAVGVASD